MSLYTDLQLALDETGGPVFWGTAQIYDALNASLMMTEGDSRYAQTTSTITITAGADLVALPSTGVMIPQALLTEEGKEVFSTTHALLEDWTARWRAEPASRPQWLVLWDALTLRVFPTADATYEYILNGVPWPTEITTSSDDITIDGHLKRAVVHSAAARLLELTQPSLADWHRSEADEARKRFRRRLRRSEGQSRLRPGSAWQVAQGGRLILGQGKN